MRVSDLETTSPGKNFLIILICLVAITLFTGCKKDALQPGTKTIEHWTVTTVAGDGDSSFADGPVASAKFAFPNDVAVEADGALFVTDGENRLVRKIKKRYGDEFCRRRVWYSKRDGFIRKL